MTSADIVCMCNSSSVTFLKKSIISQDIYCSCVIYLRVRTDVEIRTITEVRKFEWLLLPAPIHAEISTATMSFAKAPQMIRE